MNLIFSLQKITYNFWNCFFSQLLYVYDTHKLAEVAIAKSELKYILYFIFKSKLINASNIYHY